MNERMEWVTAYLMASPIPFPDSMPYGNSLASACRSMGSVIIVSCEDGGNALRVVLV